MLPSRPASKSWRTLPLKFTDSNVPLPGNLEAGLAESREDPLEKAAGVMPALDASTFMRGKVGVELEQRPDRRLGLGASAQVPAHPCDRQVLPEMARHVDVADALEGPFVVLVAEVLPERTEVVPVGVMGLRSIARRQIEAPRSNSPVSTIMSPRIASVWLSSTLRDIARSAAGRNAFRSRRKKCVFASI